MGVTRIQHNLSAMNAMSNYQGNSNRLTGNLEKLSSGYRINSAADDAAGLAISEKMRSQIAGLEKAQDNANDGISLVQTAEGALTEVNSMLTRLKTLATQSANGTYEDGVDRENIQEETDALLSEIDRISQSTNFNGISLLDGSLDGNSQVSNLAITETTATAAKFTIGSETTGIGAGTAASFSQTSTALTEQDIGKSVSYTVTWKDADGNEKTTTAKLTFMGQDGKTVADLTSNSTAGKNYFVDAQGTKYTLASNATLSSTDIQAAIKAGLESDKDFSAAFKIDTTTSVGMLKFESKGNGSNAAQIVGGAATVDDFESTAAATALKDQVDGTNGKGAAVQEQYALDSYQRFTSAAVGAANSKSTAAEIEDAIFEIDGSKFLVVDSTFTNSQMKALDSDINVYTLSSEGATDLKGAGDADAEKLAALIQKQTGREIEYVTTSAYNANSTSTYTPAGINSQEFVFKDADNKLKLDGNELSLQIGDTNKDYQKVSVKIQDMSSKGLGLSGLDLSNQESAGNAVDTIQNAINKVSTQRGQLGALQNRLDHTLNSLDATTQNITAAESQIRDVDMAKEMTQYSKNNILVQAAQSMLAQANSLPQGVLSLLQ